MNNEAFNLIQQAVTQASMTPEEAEKAAKLEQRLQRLEQRRITPDKQLPQMEFLFRLFHKPCFPRGELVALSGKAKSGKTFVSSLLMALSFRNPVLSLERIEPKRLHVLWYDTEQSEESTQDILRQRIIPMTGIPEDQFPMQLFDVFNVRPDGVDERLPMLEAAVSHYRPDLVVLDGIRDLVADINDGVVAQDCIERLMHLASDNRCCIVCILHQNKSTEDRNLRGWIGTELKNKAFEVYSCEKNSERIFTWYQTDTRKYDIVDSLKFAVNEEGIPYLCSEEQLKEALYESQRKALGNKELLGRKAELAPFNPKYVERREGRYTIFKTRELFTDCMRPGQEYGEEELKKQLGLISNIAKDKLLYEQINKAVGQGVILKSRSAINGKNIYMLRPVVASKPKEQEQDLPF